MWKKIVFPCAAIVLLTGCGGTADPDSVAVQQTTTFSEISEGVETTSETKVSTETSRATTESSRTTESEIADTTTDFPEEKTVETVFAAAEATTYVASQYRCAIDIPAGWVATDGAGDGVITSDVCVFEPETPNGDSISLFVQAEAEDPDLFAAMTKEDFAEAYAQALETVSVNELTPILLDGCAGYSMQLTGTVHDIAVEITQLIVNRPEESLWYSLTYANYSGAQDDFPNEIITHFHLT